MGEVFRARAYGAAGVTKDVCIKRIRPERLAVPGVLDAFVREARLSARLTHPNIVPVFDFGRCGDEYFLAMEWVDGVDLSALLAGPTLPDHVLAQVACDVARALDYAHTSAPDAPIVHRDVKPANILVSRSGDARLGDFGVATIAGVGEGVAGTPSFMAPEQRAGATDVRSDLYALGLWLRQSCALDDESLRALVDRLVSEDPADRPSAGAVASELETYVAYARADGAPSPREVLAERVGAFDLGARDSVDASLECTESLLHPGDAPTAPTRDSPVPPPNAPPRRAKASRLWAMIASLLVVAAAAAFWLGAPDRGGSEGAMLQRPPEAPIAALTASTAIAPGENPPEPIPPAPIEPARVEASLERVEARPPPARAARRRVPSRTEPSAPVAEPQASGRLSVNANPWAMVSIDGSDHGETPITGVELSPGPHRVVFTYGGVTIARDVTVVPGNNPPLVVRMPASTTTASADGHEE